MRTISVGHSPDADDIFMYYAIKFGWVGIENTKFENIALDIETLNQATLKGIYDICAISFALYPFVKDDFALLKTAVSFGEGYGPKLIKKKGTKLKKNFKVALSGEFTTNALLFKIAYPDAEDVVPWSKARINLSCMMFNYFSSVTIFLNMCMVYFCNVFEAFYFVFLPNFILS